jgi:uncharacterized protein YjiS (DUF1127 family)
MATHVINPQRADLLAGAAQSSPTRRLAGLLASFNRWRADRRRYRTTVRALEALDDDILADVGVTRGDIETIARRVVAHGRWR